MTEGQRLDYVAGEYYEQAMLDAKAKDQLMKEAKESNDFSKIGLFHGVPICVKDKYGEKDRICTVGTCSLSDFKPKEDCVLVKVMKNEGAICMVRGHCPQWMLVNHTESAIWGKARNHIKEDRTTGGSSGGDAGLVGTKCVPFSISSDIGGSIRTPAAFAGVVGYKPTP
jgi:Asp-tRNA(Asn)/Glu-tRNA(Gln) amidotransferase A subunit family amidase